MLSSPKCQILYYITPIVERGDTVQLYVCAFTSIIKALLTEMGNWKQGQMMNHSSSESARANELQQ